MDRIILREVGPRDGLQNEQTLFSAADKLEMIERLCRSGVDEVEVTSFVKLPQFQDSIDVAKGCLKLKERYPAVRFSALVPNQKGYDLFREAPLDEACFFVGASETFNQKNVGRSIEEHIERFLPVLEQMKADRCHTLAYLSTVCGCPYEGEISVEQVVVLAERLYELGFERLSLGDTIGVGRPQQVEELVDAVAAVFPLDRLAWHGHDTYGRALANGYAAFQCGVRIFDASIGGLGGCPYAPGAKGNLATEDLVDLFSCEQFVVEELDGVIRWLGEHLPHRDLGGNVFHARHSTGEKHED